MKKFAKVLVSAAALALTFVVASADTVDITKYYDSSDTGNNTVYLTNETDKDDNVKFVGLANDYEVDLTKVQSVSYYVTLKDGTDFDATWYGGKIGTNSMAGWADTAAWTTAANEDGTPVDSDILVQDILDGESFVLTVTIAPGVYVNPTENSKGELVSDWPRTWLQSYGGAIEVTKVTMEYDGTLTAVGGAEAPADETPADETPADNTPATGDATSIALLSVVAVLALGGVVVSSKKRA